MNYSPPTGRKHILLLVALFFIVQLALLWIYGIYTKEEAVKYIYEARYFMEHDSFSQPKYIFYSGYIFLHILSDLTATGKTGMYLIQLALNAFATICFYKLTYKISGKRTAAVIATVLLLLCIPYQKWTAYLFTESVFFSLLLIYCYILYSRFGNLYTKPLLIFMLLCMLVLFRPTGMLVIPASLLLASYHLFKRRYRLWAFAIWLPGLIGLVFLLDTAIKGKGEFDFIKPFVEQHIICGLPESTAGSVSSTEANSLRGLLTYVANNFIDFVKLGFRRLVSFLGLIRPYYSIMHNMLLIAAFYPVYIFATFSIRHIYMRARPFFIFSVALITTFALSVVFTCDDWHNRFIMPVMPLIFIYAGIGATNLYSAVFRKKT